MIKKIFVSTLIIFLGLSVGSAQTTQTLTTADVSPWTIPAGVTSLTVECWGGGGGGGFGRSTNGASGGGGGGGAYKITNSIVVVPGNTINFTVGTGGTGGTSGGTAAVAGGTTTFSTAAPVVANGGAAGTGVTTNTNGAGGAGGAGGTYSGGNGAAGQGASGGGGGGGSAGTGSNGNNATTQNGAAAVAGGGSGGSGANNTAGTAGGSPGGGGAGGERNGNSRGGGLGSDGQIVLTYCQAPTIIAQPQSETIVYSGTSTYFHVNVSSLAGTTYQWQRSTDGGTTWANITSANMDVGATYSDYTLATLFLAGVTPSVNGYKYKCIVTSGACSTITDGTATLIFSGNQLCGSQYRRPITINKTMVGGGVDLTNFPVLISVTDAVNLKYPGGHVANASGYDIIFTDANGTPLTFQTESYTAASGKYIGWVKIPTLSASINTTIYMYYGDATISTDQSLPTTWDTSFVAVYHLSNYNDGTVDALTGTANATSIAAAKIANGVNSFSYISAAGGASSVYNNVTQNITVSGWVNIGSTGLDQKIAGSEDNTNGGWKMGVYTDNTLEFEIRTSTNSPILNRGFGAATTLSAGTWYYVAGQYSQGASGYINTYVGGTANFTSGNPDRGSYATAGVMGTSTGTLSIGCEAFAPATANWSGTLDEIRISKVIRSVGWLQTEYNNQNNPATYITLGAESGTKTWTGTANWSTTADWSGASLPAAGADVIISSGTVTVNSNISVGSLIVKSGAGVIIGGGNTLSVASYVMDCGTISGAGTLTMNGSTVTNQNISGTGTYSLTNLVINNTSAATPSVTLQTPVGVSGNLTLTQGLLNTDAVNILTMQSGSTAPALTSASTSYVNGPMQYQKAGASTSTLNFPVGASPDCRPFVLTVNHTDVSQYNYTAQLFNANPWVAFGSGGLPTDMPSTVDTISGVHYWKIDRTNAAGVSQPNTGLGYSVGVYPLITLYFGTNDGVYQGNALTIVKNTSATPSAWIDIGGTSALGNFSSAQAGSVISTSSPTAFNSFSSFTLGSRNTGWNPLPIELLSFSAVPNDNKVDLKWETITETNNAYFTIEKSADGKTFTKLIDIPGAGNSTSYREYAETDYQPFLGTSYYRLKQTDKNGKFAYFNMVPVNFNSKNNIIVFPNPLYNTANGLPLNIKVTGYQNQEVVVVLRDIEGREFLSKVLLTEDNNQLFVVDETKSLTPGIYIITAASNDKIYNYKLIVR